MAAILSRPQCVSELTKFAQMRLEQNVHPCEKVMGLFIQNQIWARCQAVDRLCLRLLKDSLAKLNGAKYLSTVVSRSWVIAYW